MHGTADRLPASVTDLYERHALAWDSDRRAGRWNEEPWYERFLAVLPRDGTVLDLGCGAAWPVARYLADHGFHVTGVDSSPTLISLCRERLPRHEWLVHDMRTVQLGCRFNGLLAWDSFFHLHPSGQRHMFHVFAQHAAPSAVLMFNTGSTHGEAIGAYQGEPLYHASLDRGEYEDLLRESGFEVLAHAVDDCQTAGGRTVWLAQARP